VIVALFQTCTALRSVSEFQNPLAVVVVFDIESGDAGIAAPDMPNRFQQRVLARPSPLHALPIID
jgi:hypothetical protein